MPFYWRLNARRLPERSFYGCSWKRMAMQAHQSRNFQAAIPLIGILRPVYFKGPTKRRAFKIKKPGSYLLSHFAAVSSALESLTSVFGMGTGIASPLWPPGIINNASRPFASRMARLRHVPFEDGLPHFLTKDSSQSFSRIRFQVDMISEWFPTLQTIIWSSRTTY